MATPFSSLETDVCRLCRQNAVGFAGCGLETGAFGFAKHMATARMVVAASEARLGGVAQLVRALDS